MSIKKSQKKLSPYLSHMRIMEGLSFSDYFDDSVPADVKPTYSLTPLQEEGQKLVGQGWLSKDGEYFTVGKSHYFWGTSYLKSKGLYTDDDSVYENMYKLGFVRVHISPAFETISFDSPNTLTNTQLRVLKDYCIEKGWKLHDNFKHRNVDLNEGVVFNKNKELFIEHMMPEDLDTFKTHLAQLFSHLQKKLQLKSVPKVKLMEDEKNANKVLGKTAYYDPAKKLIVLFTTNRHQKDILRSFSHEVIHHWQHEHGKLEKGNAKDAQYAQKDPWMRQMEKQAYLLGNILFRDWEDEKKAKDKQSGKKIS